MRSHDRSRRLRQSEHQRQGGLSATFTGKEPIPGVVIMATGVEVSGTVSTTPAWCASSIKIVANWSLASEMPVFASFVPVGISLTSEKSPKTAAQSYPVNVAAVRSAVDTSISILKISSPAIEVKCLAANLGGGELAEEAASSFSLSGTYSGSGPEGKYCESPMGRITVNMKSCRYELPEIEQAGSSYTAKGAAITCTKEGDEIALESGVCTIKVPPQALQATLVNGGEGFGAEISLTLSSGNLKYKAKGGFCQLGGLKEEGEDATMKQELALRGTLPG
jgi:hypothetical protein